MIRVLVVDDSAFARKVVREILTTAQGIEVIGIARDGLDALEKISELKPDVVTLDLVMPHLDGIGVLRALAEVDDAPRVIVVSMVDEESDLGVQALSLGAFDVVHKPTALAVASLYDVGEQVIAKVRAAYRGRAVRVSVPMPEPKPQIPVTARTSDRIVVLGTSTGGPQALTQIVRALPADFPAPLTIALHIPPGYTEALARRLNDECALDVVEASDGLVLRRGLVVVARAGMHLKLARNTAGVNSVRVDHRPMEPLYRPSVDVLFESAAAVWGSRALGVILTGMGDDGTRGAAQIKAAGGHIITEAEQTCVVYGMPRAAKEAGHSDEEVPLHEVVAAIVRRL